MQHNEFTTNLADAFKGIPAMKQVIEILEKGEIIDHGSEIGDNRRIIGLLSPLEQAINMVIGAPLEKSKELGVFCTFDEHGPSCFPIFSTEFWSFKDLMSPDRKDHEMLRELMFALIKSRLDADARGIDDLQINSKFRITAGNHIPIPESIEVFQGSHKMDVEQMLEISLRGTLLEPIIAILKSGEFIDVETEIADGDMFIRELIPIEKSIATMINASNQAINPKIMQHEQLLQGENFTPVFRPKIEYTPFGGRDMLMILKGESDMETCYASHDDNHPDAILVRALRDEIGVEKDRVSKLDHIFWLIVTSNLNEEQVFGFEKIGQRSGFQIVIFN